MDPLPYSIQKGSHLRVPSTPAVSKVDTRLQKLVHGCYAHTIPPWVLPPFSITLTGNPTGKGAVYSLIIISNGEKFRKAEYFLGR